MMPRGYAIPPPIPPAIPPSLRTQHTYMIGSSGTGKTTFIKNLAIQDICNGEGVCILDPKDGQLSRDMLDLIPGNRVKDVIYLSADTLIPISVMETIQGEGPVEDELRGALSEDIINTFKRMRTGDQFGPRMDSILENVVHTLVRVPGTTLLTIYDALTDSEWYRAYVPNRNEFSNLLSEHLRKFWAVEFPSMPKAYKDPILSRMSTITNLGQLRAVLGQPQGRIDFADLMENRRILIVNLGSFADAAATIIGNIIISKIQVTMRRRQSIPERHRKPFYLYVDEFEDFIATPLPSLFAKARSYRVSLTVAHQWISQLDSYARQAVLTAATKAVFRVEEQDARLLRSATMPYDWNYVTNLPDRTCILRVGRAVDHIATWLPPEAEISSAEEIIRRSRALSLQPLQEATRSTPAEDARTSDNPPPFPDQSKKARRTRPPR